MRRFSRMSGVMLNSIVLVSATRALKVNTDDILKNINLEAKSGEMVALLGATGSGKTTLVNLIPRFYDVTAGSISIDDTDIREVTLASLRRQIGIVQQDVFLFYRDDKG